MENSNNKSNDYLISTGGKLPASFRLEELYDRVEFSDSPNYRTTQPQIYKPANDNGFPICNYLMLKTGKYVNYIGEPLLLDSTIDSHAVKAYLESNGYSLVWKKESFTTHNRLGTRSGFFYEKEIPETKGIIAVMIGDMEERAEDNTDSFVDVYGVDADSEIPVICEVIRKNLKPITYKENNVHLVISTQRGYDTTPFELPESNVDIELNYGGHFQNVHDKIINELNKPKGKGLVLLHGTPGTGKTHYLKHLASLITKKRVLFIPPYLADFITSPEMTPFLISNSNSILFIEDAERVITDRSTNPSPGVSNILNLTDGILSDILNIQIVATFNMDKHKIDTALLRKGRLIAEHKFDALSVEESQNLLNHLKIEHTATKPMTLTEIYNINEVEYKSEAPRRIGFGS